MKFEQALGAMRRGEKVRRKCWDKRLAWRIVGGGITADGDRLGSEAYDITAESVLAVDWVISRKKTLRDPFADPYVGDKFKQAIGTMRFEVVIINPKCIVAKRNDLMHFVHSWREWEEMRKDWIVTHRASKTT